MTDSAEKMLIMSAKSKSTDIRVIAEDFLQGYIDMVRETGMIEGEYEHFEAKGRYKPGTANAVQSVVANTIIYGENSDDPETRALCVEPDPIEVVHFTDVERTNFVNLDLTKIGASKKDVRVYTSVAKRDNLPIDYAHAIRSILPLISQFISYHKDFADPEQDLLEYKYDGIYDEMIRTTAKRSVERAKDFLSNKLKEDVKTFPFQKISEEFLKQIGDFRKTYKNIYSDWVSTFTEDNSHVREFMLIIKENDMKSNTVKKFISRAEAVRVGTKYYKDIELMSGDEYNSMHEDLDKFREALMSYEKIISKIYMSTRYHFNQNLHKDLYSEVIYLEDWTVPIDEDDKEVIKKFYMLFLRFCYYSNVVRTYHRYQLRGRRTQLP